MIENFNLSEKQKNMPVETEWERTGESEYDPVKWEYRVFYSEEDVKEFIKRLKEITKRNSGCEYMLNWEEIDKLAGEELIGTNHPTPDLNEDGEVIGYS